MMMLFFLFAVTKQTANIGQNDAYWRFAPDKMKKKNCSCRRAITNYKLHLLISIPLFWIPKDKTIYAFIKTHSLTHSPIHSLTHSFFMANHWTMVSNILVTQEAKISNDLGTFITLIFQLNTVF